MGSEEIRTLCQQMSAMVEMLEQRSLQRLRQAEQGQMQLAKAIQDFDRETRQVPGEAASILRTQSRQAVEAGTGEALADFRRQLQELVRVHRLATGELQQLQGDLRARHRWLLHAGALALLLGSALAVGGCVYVVSNRLQAVEKVRLSEELVEATRRGSLVRCGDQLCARVGRSAKYQDAEGEYMVVR